MFSVFQLIIDPMMSIDLILFFIALFSQLSLSLYFMTLTLLKTIMLLSLPLSLSIELSSFGIGLIFPHSYIQVRHSRTEYIIDVSFSMNDIWKHTPSLCPSWVISIFIIWSRCCAISALNSYCSFLCKWWPVSRETLKAMQISCSLWKLPPRFNLLVILA